jgi:hypothetical protein
MSFERPLVIKIEILISRLRKFSVTILVINQKWLGQFNRQYPMVISFQSSGA